jgi:hypothetical protein
MQEPRAAIAYSVLKTIHQGFILHQSKFKKWLETSGINVRRNADSSVHIIFIETKLWKETMHQRHQWPPLKKKKKKRVRWWDTTFSKV